MTPKEKAKELIEKFDKEFDDGYASWKYSEKCALICVDEIIQSSSWEYNEELHLEFWENVKDEIKIL